METSEVFFILAIVLATYWISDPTVKTKQPKKSREKGIVLEQKLHAIRLNGINVDRMYDMAGELVRRGVPIDKIPRMDASTQDLKEVQARMELMMEEVPYVPRNLQEPGEDRTLAKSSYQLWPRKLEQQNGDN